MKNINLIYGPEEYLINKYKKELINEINSSNIITYNLLEESISSVLLEASTISMFEDKKIIICENSNFLTSNGKLTDEETKKISEYLLNPFEDVYIIFICFCEKLDERKKIVKELKKYSKVYICEKIENYNLNNYLNEYIISKGYNITQKNIELLIKKAGLNLNILINEIDKLIIYKYNEKEITKEDIDGLVVTNIEDNIFSLTNAFMDEDKSKTIKIYNDLLLLGIKHEAIIGVISNQLRLLLQVNLMKKNGYSDKEMVSILLEHPYRIKLAKEKNYSIKKLKNKILDLCYLDLNIKSNKIDKNLGLELFLLNF